MKFLFTLSFFLFGLFAFGQNNCLDLSPYDNAYLNEVSQNDSLHPVGAAFIQTGYIQLVKPTSGNAYQFINGDTLCYIGKIEMNVASAPFSNRQLVFGSMFTQGLVIDGDTIFTANNPPASYTGSGFTMTYTAPYYTVSGDFDVVHIYGSTNCLYGICLLDLGVSPTCLDLSPYDNAYLNEVSQNDSLHPVGAAFIQTGYIQLVKPTSGNAYQFINGDTLCYIGKIEINVSTAPFSNKQLVFGSMFTQGLVIDGDTVFTNNNPPASYTGSGFTMTYTAPYYTVSGDFDVVHIYGSTNCLYGICLSDLNGTTAVIDNSINKAVSEAKIYPNPSNGRFTIDLGSISDLNYMLVNSQGVLLKSGTLQGASLYQMQLDDYPAGLYLLILADVFGNKIVKKMVLENK